MNENSQIAMVVYPGSNCDQDCERVFKEKFQIKINRVWHQEETLPQNTKGLIIPGGFPTEIISVQSSLPLSHISCQL